MKLLILLLISIFSLFGNEFVDDLNNKSHSIGWYFWMSDSGKSYLASEKSDGSIAVWNFTDERKWKPIHNAPAFDSYAKAEKVFDEVKFSNDGKEILFYSNSTSNTTVLSDLVGTYKMTSSKVNYANGTTLNLSEYDLRNSYLKISSDGKYDNKVYVYGNLGAYIIGKVTNINGDKITIYDSMKNISTTVRFSYENEKLTTIATVAVDSSELFTEYDYWQKTSNNTRSLKKENAVFGTTLGNYLKNKF